MAKIDPAMTLRPQRGIHEAVGTLARAGDRGTIGGNPHRGGKRISGTKVGVAVGLRPSIEFAAKVSGESFAVRGNRKACPGFSLRKREGLKAGGLSSGRNACKQAEYDCCGQ